ncbi:MAG: serine protease [Oligoflexales bacterium]
MMKVFAILIMGSVLVPRHGSGEVFPEVIYGEDNRRDLYELGSSKSQLKNWARSTAIISSQSKVKDSSLYGFKKLVTKSLETAQNVCADEPYAEQPIGGWCTGFLVREDILVTAGHCITSESRCATAAIIFDYGYAKGDEQLEYAKEDNIYSCKKIISQEYDSGRGLDYAVIQLDRKVKGRTPLKLRTNGKVSSYASLTVIGHPTGLPTKVAEGAFVRENANNYYFVSNTDTYGGNSGSPVMNSNGLVEGVLVRGEKDFVQRGGCNVSFRCAANECRGEDVTRSTTFSHLVY